LTNKFLDKIVRVAAVVPELRVANVDFNVQKIIECIKVSCENGAEVIVFPELSITGYSCADLFYQSSFLKSAMIGLEYLAKSTKDTEALITVGLPLTCNGRIYNCAAVLQSGSILGFVPKQIIPNKREFYEARWFSSGRELIDQYIRIQDQLMPLGKNLVFVEKRSGLMVGIEICEDLWSPVPPSSSLALSGANLILNLSASNALVGKAKRRRDLIREHSERILCGYVYSSSGPNESTSDLVFSGHAMVAECGKVFTENTKIDFNSKIVYGDIDLELIDYERFLSPGFSGENSCEDLRYIQLSSLTSSKKDSPCSNRNNNPTPFIPVSGFNRELVCHEIIEIQSAALQKRMLSGNFDKVVLGLSGGLDSTLALLVAERTFEKLDYPKSGIIAVTMPGVGTSKRTYSNAVKLSKVLGMGLREISIEENANINYRDINHDQNCHDLTFENVQARIRTQILMNIANKESSFVLGTGDLSEAALGWCTYNGDHMSMYQINGGVPKTLVKYLIEWFADDISHQNSREILKDILNTPISPELLPLGKNNNEIQKTEDLVGPYELHDYFLFNFVRYGYSPEKIFYFSLIAFKDRYSSCELLHWMEIFFTRFFSQQYKRSAVPDGPKIGSVGLSPKSDWRMPSDVSANNWLNEIKNIKQKYNN
jgi:NAD+ synthase (glutamine-hydrolysing)